LLWTLGDVKDPRIQVSFLEKSGYRRPGCSPAVPPERTPGEREYVINSRRDEPEPRGKFLRNTAFTGYMSPCSISGSPRL
jgi:hypothetical protein